MDAHGFIFGSLAQRSTFNQSALDRILATLPQDAWRVFDVNLRAPHDDLMRVRELAKQATILKLNAEEAAHIAADENEAPGREEGDAQALAEQTGCPTICVTSGSRGAGLLHDGKWYWEDANPVQVVDTIGAGDAFLSTLIVTLMRKQLPVAECLTQACRLGEWVTSQYGATPTYRPLTSN
jgi:fructokinase